MGTYILIGVIVLVVIYFVGIYNGLIRARNETKNGWAQIDVQLKRRHDLIPNLVETAKGYMQHEAGTLEKVVAARNQAVAAQGPKQAGAAEGVLSGARSIQRRREFRQHVVAGGVHHAVPVLSHQHPDLLPVCPEGADRVRLVLGHQAAVADRVGAEDGSQSAFDAFGVHGRSGRGSTRRRGLHEGDIRWQVR